MEQTKPRATVTNTRADSMCLSHAHAHARGHTVRLFHAEPSNTPALWRCVNTHAHTNTRVWEDLWGSHTNSGSNTVKGTDRNSVEWRRKQPAPATAPFPGDHPWLSTQTREGHTHLSPHRLPEPGAPAPMLSLAAIPTSNLPASPRSVALTGSASSLSGEEGGRLVSTGLASFRKAPVWHLLCAQKRALSADRGYTAN